MTAPVQGRVVLHQIRTAARAGAGLALAVAVAVGLSVRAARVAPERGVAQTEHAGGSLVIRNATLILSAETAPVPNAVIHIRNGLVECAGLCETSPVGDGQTPALDANGRFVIPGLVDLHQHNVGVAGPARRWLAHGVTSVRDPGADLVRARRLRAAIEHGREAGPRLFLGLLVDLEADDTPRTVRERIAAEAAVGLDLVKLYLRTPIDHASAAIDEAHGRGLPVTWHLSLPLSRALDLGVDGVEHLYVFRELMPEFEGEAPATTSAAFHRIYARWARHLDPASEETASLFRRMARLGVVWTPTLGLARRIATGESEYSRDWKPAERADGSRGFDAACRMVGEAHRLGVAIGAGTDTENPADLHNELALLAECGLSPSAALAAATSVAARALRREATVGRVAPGAFADLVILDADPTRDIRNTTRIWRVVKDGVVFEPARLD